MATQLFLRTIAEAGVSIGSYSELELTTTRGAGVTNGSANTTAGGDHIVMRYSAIDAIWLYQVNAVTISGTITFNFWGHEGVMTTNVGMAAIVSRYNSAGTFVSDVVAQANANHADGVEMATTDAAMNWTATPTSTAFSAGDWLAVLIHVDAVGTMATGDGFLRFDGTSAAADGDSYVTFTETIDAYVPAAAAPVAYAWPAMTVRNNRRILV